MYICTYVYVKVIDYIDRWISKKMTLKDIKISNIAQISEQSLKTSMTPKLAFFTTTEKNLLLSFVALPSAQWP